MNVQITTRRFKLSEKLEKEVRKEVDVLSKHFDGIHEIQVVLTTDHGVRHVDLTVRVPHHTFNSEVEGNQQFIELMPIACKKMSVQIQRYKEKLKKL